MSTGTNASTISEIDAIIARAMEEYRNAKGIDPFAEAAAPVEEIEEAPSIEPEEIPVNSNSILVSEETSRFSGALWFDNIQARSVTLAGLGGIGSYVAFLLSRFHINRLILYDDDTVEAGNMSGQLYGFHHIGQNKATAISSFIGEYSRFYDVFSYTERFTEESTGTEIMMCGFDSMAARKIYFNKWLEVLAAIPEDQRSQALFIDGRLAAESFQVLCIKGDDQYSIDRYRQHYLFSDAEADETICSYKQTTFMANMIASVMVNLFVNFCANNCNPLVPRDLPFLTEYSADTMYFKVVA